MSKRRKSAPPAAATGSEIVLYQTEDGRTRLDVRLENETVWLTQAQMAELFLTTKQNVSLHIQNVFTEKELREDSVVKESLTTAAAGKNYATKFYNLDVIISVGYRVKSVRGRLPVGASHSCPAKLQLWQFELSATRPRRLISPRYFIAEPTSPWYRFWL